MCQELAKPHRGKRNSPAALFFGLRLGTGSARQAARKISNGVNRKSILRAQQKSHGVRGIVAASVKRA
jgi:hypothetical protein